MCSFRRKVLFESGLDDLQPNQATVPVEWRFGREADLTALTAPEFGYSTEAREFGRERLRAGDRFVVCEADQRVVFYAWVMFGQLDLSCRNYLQLAPDRAYTYKLYTVPSFRGRCICPAYYSFLKGWLKEMGFRSVMAWVEAGNKASIHAHERSGLRPAGTIWHWQFLGRPYFVIPEFIAPAESRLESRDGRVKAGSTSIS